MRCEEVMKRDVECVEPTDTAQQAAQLMQTENIGFLPVCENNKVVGTLTDRDICLRLVAQNLPATTSVSQLFTKEVVACRPSDDLRRAEQLMGKNHKSRMLVIDDNEQLCGVISLSDVIDAEKGSRAADTLRQVAQRETHAT